MALVRLLDREWRVLLEFCLNTRTSNTPSVNHWYEMISPCPASSQCISLCTCSMMDIFEPNCDVDLFQGCWLGYPLGWGWYCWGLGDSFSTSGCHNGDREGEDKVLEVIGGWMDMVSIKWAPTLLYLIYIKTGVGNVIPTQEILKWVSSPPCYLRDYQLPLPMTLRFLLFSFPPLSPFCIVCILVFGLLDFHIVERGNGARSEWYFTSCTEEE